MIFYFTLPHPKDSSVPSSFYYIGPEALMSVAKKGCRAWDRTKILAFKGRCPTVRRPGNADNINIRSTRLFSQCVAESAFAKTDASRRYFRQFVIAEIFQTLFQRHNPRRDKVVGDRVGFSAEVSELFLFANI
ncbi:MAG: hypothetical protein Athens071426_689 [Parcubacteria group bacterium Athens0714_26]|nr:MAG: hypothetical protein Athens071426_689 [Parcubacteria group bacterium Athens0714_26]